MSILVAPLQAKAEPLLASQPLDLHIGRLIAVLIFCIALAFGAAYFLRRAGKGGLKAMRSPWMGAARASEINVLETRRLSVHADVCRLSCAGREYLVVVSQAGATLLKDSEAAREGQR